MKRELIYLFNHDIGNCQIGPLSFLNAPICKQSTCSCFAGGKMFLISVAKEKFLYPSGCILRKENLTARISSKVKKTSFWIDIDQNCYQIVNQASQEIAMCVGNIFWEVIKKSFVGMEVVTCWTFINPLDICLSLQVNFLPRGIITSRY